MIKFFRHIRQRLIRENRFSKYALYAIGEIVLVVIGILIALQINNANENRKTRNQKVKYLKHLWRAIPFLAFGPMLLSITAAYYAILTLL